MGELNRIKTPAGEILVEVIPKEASKFRVVEVVNNSFDMLEFRMPNEKDWWHIEIPKGNWEIVGTISHKRGFGFDPEPYVLPEIVGIDRTNQNYIHRSPASVFIEMIESQGEILWSNPMGRKRSFGHEMEDRTVVSSKEAYEFNKWESEWQSYESKVLKETEQVIVLVKKNQ